MRVLVRIIMLRMLAILLVVALELAIKIATPPIIPASMVAIGHRELSH